jgi:outer membrane protein OmpA-like peptidoglycan-associated protein
MKIRSLALLGAVALALTSPALADEPGWYLGLGAGYDHLNQIHFRNNANLTNGWVPQSDRALALSSFGYKWDAGLRTELELGYSWHSAAHTAGVTSGGESVSSALLNAVYDLKLGEDWALSLGGGVGVGDANAYWRCGGVKCLGGTAAGFEWQGIAGLSYALAEDVDAFVDYRYRSTEVRHDFAAFNAPGPHTNHVGELNEQVALVGVRWYLAQPAPPAPPPEPPAPPPPPPPPPVKTFIVFFDFDKSNLSTEGQTVVSEAVKTAKQSGFVKVMVTGHTDTVGSDAYNQALSVRRAETVKDEMVHEGMDGSTISIEGKSFHDPLVSTGPGVREPQNRRAVIDLGG